jgi:hypothetical protein
MRKLTLVSLALVILTGSAFASVGTYDIADGDYEQVFTATPMNASRADTVYLIGGPDRNDGKFQDDVSGTLPDEEGWIGVDLTAKVPVWHVSTYRTGGNAAYCGDELIASCGGTDPVGGYGANYLEWLDWTGTVADPMSSTLVEVTGTIWYDNEPGYDYSDFAVVGPTSATIIGSWNGTSDAAGEAIAISVTVNPSDYVGPSSDQVNIRFVGRSDGAWDDSDCLWPTQGHTNLDDLAVSLDGVQVTFDDFEAGLGNWEVVLPVSVGDFAKVWPSLTDIDPCRGNQSPQFAFVDDGIVEPCTGGTIGQTWLYGPGGYIVNHLGGCAGPDFHMQNEIWSPQLDYPAGAYDGATLQFDIFRHQIIDNGMFYVWHVRSSVDAGATWDGWQDRNFVYYGGPDYSRVSQSCTDLMLPGRNAAQIALGLNELGWVWNLEGTDGTAAPYIDNVAFFVYEFGGPGISTREIELANDNFPAIGDLDFADLGANDVRFDMAMNIAAPEDMINLPGDSITFDVVAVRTGSALDGLPKMYWSMKQNPLFDAYRADPATSGFVYGDSIFTSSGALVPDRYAFDLPDEDFMYPGDVVHYYIEASDDLGGVSTLPSNIDGFDLFPGDAGYTSFEWSSSYTVRALPTIFDAAGDQPAILLWNDYANRGGENEWVFAMNANGYVEGTDYDVYYTNGPSSGVGSGLGGRATLPQINGYETLLYTSGDLSAYTISNGDYAQDAGNDIDLLDQWLQNGKNALFTGDDLTSDLMSSGGATVNFVSTWFSVDFLGNDLRPVIGSQPAPLVLPIAGNSVNLTTEFIAYGGCLGYNTFDIVTPNGSCERIAEFADASGNGGVYSYAAGTYNAVNGSNVVYFPVDFMYWYNTDAPGNARAAVLNDILLFFGHLGSIVNPVVDAPELGVFAAKNFPNPFNPLTKIQWTIPQAGDLSIKIFNVRGELVNTLVDEAVTTTSGVAEWAGKDNSGSDVASGVYFYEVRSGNNVTVNKMALVK